MKTPQEILWSYALRALARKACTTQELQDKLARHRAYEPAQAAAIIQKLSQMNYLNDREFVARVIEQSARSKPMGLRGLQARLARKGIASEWVAEAFRSADVNEVEWAKSALQKNAHKWERTPLEKRKQKQWSFLAARGFSSSAAMKAVHAYHHPETPCA